MALLYQGSDGSLDAESSLLAEKGRQFTDISRVCRCDLRAAAAAGVVCIAERAILRAVLTHNPAVYCVAYKWDL